eukprot:360870-Chlamydomonas_euryale.AAC.3
MAGTSPERRAWTFVACVHTCSICMRDPSVYPIVKPRRGGPCTKHVPRPQVETYHTCRGRGRHETEDMHARTCPRPQAEGHLLSCVSEAAGRSRPRQA